MTTSFSIILPAKNESTALRDLLPRLLEHAGDGEIIIVNDGSTDDTKELCSQYAVKVINEPYSKGNGAAIKTGARAASGEILVFMDADGQHSPEDINKLLERMEEGYDMVVGARDTNGQSSFTRHLANGFYNFLASWITDQDVKDLTSGFRAVRANVFHNYLHLLPNGFSYPTTITMALFRAGYSISYLPLTVKKRIGESHIKLAKDGVRFLLIIFKIGTLYSPLKLFFPASLFFFLTGIVYYAYTFILYTRFTNMSALLISTSIVIFLMGLISEQLTVLLYSKINNKD